MHSYTHTCVFNFCVQSNQSIEKENTILWVHTWLFAPIQSKIKHKTSYSIFLSLLILNKQTNKTQRKRNKIQLYVFEAKEKKTESLITHSSKIILYYFWQNRSLNHLQQHRNDLYCIHIKSLFIDSMRMKCEWENHTKAHSWWVLSNPHENGNNCMSYNCGTHNGKSIEMA